GRDRLTRRRRERAAEVKGRDADGRGDAIEGEILGEVALYEPQRLAGHGRWHHDPSIEPSASPGLMVLAIPCAPMRTLITVLALSVLPFVAPTDWRTAPAGDWQTIFNGRNLDGWVVKLAHHEVGDNYADTFRVENGTIRV